MILLVSEIHWTRGFCDEQQGEDEQELGILVVGFSYYKSAFLRFCKLYFFYYWGVYFYGAQKCSLQSFKLPHLPSLFILVSQSVYQWVSDRVRLKRPQAQSGKRLFTPHTAICQCYLCNYSVSVDFISWTNFVVNTKNLFANNVVINCKLVRNLCLSGVKWWRWALLRNVTGSIGVTA